MKKLFIALTFLCYLKVSAQNVGINTSSPSATLQVVGQPGTTTIADGIVIPTITGNQLKNKDGAYGASQTGAIVYVTAAATSPFTGKTENITSAGFYYYDGSVWQKAAVTSAIDTTNDAFVNDVTNTMVKLKTRADGVTSRAADAEFVIKDDGKVGIGLTAPGRMLDVNGSINVTDDLTIRRGATEGGQLTLHGQLNTDANWTIDQINNASTPRFRIFGGSNENNGIRITESGNVSAPNGWVRGFASGQLLNSVFIDDPTMLTGPFNTTTFNNLISYNYTPVHNNSTIMVQYHNNSYLISGGMGGGVDEFQSQITIGGGSISVNTQQPSQASSVNSTFRTGTLFPIVGVVANSGTAAIAINIQLRRSQGDDNISFSGTNGTLIIQEIAR